MNKEEKIHKAYQDLLDLDVYNHVKLCINLDGWLPMRNLPTNFNLDSLIGKFNYSSELDLNVISIRPKSLNGIENNNGWVKIETEKDLPKNECYCSVVLTDEDGNMSINHGFFYSNLDNSFDKDYNSFKWNEISHYHIINLPNELSLI